VIAFTGLGLLYGLMAGATIASERKEARKINQAVQDGDLTSTPYSRETADDEGSNAVVGNLDDGAAIAGQESASLAGAVENDLWRYRCLCDPLGCLRNSTPPASLSWLPSWSIHPIVSIHVRAHVRRNQTGTVSLLIPGTELDLYVSASIYLVISTYVVMPLTFDRLQSFGNLTWSNCID